MCVQKACAATLQDIISLKTASDLVRIFIYPVLAALHQWYRDQHELMVRTDVDF